MYEGFIRIIQSSIECSASNNEQVLNKSRKLKPWITNELVRVIANRKSIYNKLIKHPYNVEIKITYNKLKAKIVK